MMGAANGAGAAAMRQRVDTRTPVNLDVNPLLLFVQTLMPWNRLAQPAEGGGAGNDGAGNGAGNGGGDNP